MTKYCDKHGKLIKSEMRIKHNDGKVVKVVEQNDNLYIEWCDHLFPLSDISLNDWHIVKDTTNLSPYRYQYTTL